MLTDIILVFFIVLFFSQGWQNGLLCSLISPACMLICVLASSLYLDITDNMIVAIMIAVGGTVILATVISSFFNLWRRTIDKRYRNYCFPGSQLAGALVSLGWLGGLTVGALLLFTLIPSDVEYAKNMQENIGQSKICALTDEYVIPRIAPVRNFFTVVSVFKNQERLLKISQTPEFEDLIETPKLQECLKDENILKNFEEMHLIALVTNPKILGLLGDQKTMRNLTLVIKKMYTEGMKEPENQQPAPPVPLPSPTGS